MRFDYVVLRRAVWRKMIGTKTQAGRERWAKVARYLDKREAEL